MKAAEKWHLGNQTEAATKSNLVTVSETATESVMAAS
jgi:hypothetical protein